MQPRTHAARLSLTTRPWSVNLERTELAIVTVIAGFALSALAGFLITGHLYDHASLTPVWLLILAVAAGGLVVGLWWSQEIAVALRYWAYFFAISILGSLNGSLLASAGLPLIDSHLAAADRLIGFEWRTTFSSVAHSDSWLVVLSVAYSTLAWQPVVLIGLLAIGRHGPTMQRFVLAWGLALAVTLAISPFTPALGNFLYHGYEHADYPSIRVASAWNFAENFAAMRSGTVQIITRDSLDGLVTFPSFHTSGAVLLAMAWSAVPRVRLAFCLLNAAMIVSAVIVGGHYLVDVLAGLMIAFGAWAGVDRVLRARTA